MIWLLCFSLLFLFLFAFLFDFRLGAVVYMKWRLTNTLYVCMCMYVCMYVLKYALEPQGPVPYPHAKFQPHISKHDETHSRIHILHYFSNIDVYTQTW